MINLHLASPGNVLEHFEWTYSDDKHAKAADEATLKAIEEAGENTTNWTAENPVDKRGFVRAYSDH